MKGFTKKLDHMKIQKRLLVCFILVVAFASLSGIIGTILLVRTDNNYSKALVENGFSQGEIGAFNTYLNKGGAVVRDIIFLENEEDIKKSQDELTSIQTIVNEEFEALKISCQTKKELEYIAVIDEKMPLYREARDQVMELSQQNKNKEAFELFSTKARPVLNEITEAAKGLADYNVELGEEVSASLTAQSRVTVIIIIAVIVSVFFISILFARFIAKSVANPIIEVKDASAKLARGELNIEIDATTEDEIGEMISSFKEATGMMQLYIKDIAAILGEIAGGNFDVASKVEYKGDFIAIQDAITKIIVELSTTLNQINEGSEQVAMGSVQMAENAQALAEGATEQAGAVEELTATIQDLTSLVEDNAHKANASYENAKKYEGEAEDSSKEMEELTEAMGRINDTSKEIENIIAQIEDIASQTNLLSLNASIEAARAGEAGKGFAVVADQIGKLASDSANSAVNTRNLIGNTLSEIEKGNEITGKTSDSIERVIEGIKALANSSKDISDSAKSQAESMKQIEQGVEQISSVIQSNSASAEETSATSEELSAQSENLKALVEQFNLNENVIHK
ncbi:MAG: HAMP domain-containing methyl-accepting chemotaxis protein [Lachnospiraceae bacterium]